MAGILKVDQIKATGSGGNVEIPSGTTLHAPGHIIQVKKATVNTRTTFTSSAYVNTNLTINFTPKFADSMLHVMCTGGLADYASTATVGAIFKRVISGTTTYSPLGSTGHGNINSPNGATMAVYQGGDGATNNKMTPFTMEWFDDTHNTTNQIAYTVMVANNHGSSTTAFGGLGDQDAYNIVSTISVWEIAQ